LTTISNIVVFVYDGAENMSGEKRAAVYIKQIYPRETFRLFIAISGSHVLNLAMVKTCEMQSLRTMMGTLSEMCIFKYFFQALTKIPARIGNLSRKQPRKKWLNYVKLDG